VRALVPAALLAACLAALTGCAPAALTVTLEHPASPDAPGGRLAGPPAALRPGVVEAAPPAGAPAQPAHDHRGHH
jgi:hypothetical protein